MYRRAFHRLKTLGKPATASVVCAAYFLTQVVGLHAAERSLWEERRRAASPAAPALLAELPQPASDVLSRSLLSTSRVTKDFPGPESAAFSGEAARFLKTVPAALGELQALEIP